MFSGFSGSGKGTVMQELIRGHEEEFSLSVSATTRAPRETEQDGREYFFKTREEFEKMIEKNELIEYALYVGNYYGTPKVYVQEQLEAGKDVVLEIEIQGARKIKEMFPDAVLLFITTKDAETLQARLSGRGTESEEAVRARLMRASEEASGIKDYDYLLVNDVAAQCAQEARAVIRGEHQKVSRNMEAIRRIKEDLGRFSKGE